MAHINIIHDNNTANSSAAQLKPCSKHNLT